jgi:hypothetical protein
MLSILYFPSLQDIVPYVVKVSFLRSWRWAKVCPKHAELILEINKTVIVASSWSSIFTLPTLMMHGQTQIKNIRSKHDLRTPSCNTSLLPNSVLHMGVRVYKRLLLKIKQRDNFIQFGKKWNRCCWIIRFIHPKSSYRLN